MKNLAAHNTQGVRGWAVAEPHPSGDGSFYAPIAQGLSESDARFFAHACNSVERLERENKAKTDALREIENWTRCMAGNPQWESIAQTIQQIARDAIPLRPALAQGGAS